METDPTGSPNHQPDVSKPLTGDIKFTGAHPPDFQENLNLDVPLRHLDISNTNT